MNNYFSPHAFQLENGEQLPELNIAYASYGSLNVDKSNVIWICHALTANADATEWWPGIIGPDKVFDPEKYFIVCANIIGSCYGSTGPQSINPQTHQPYLNSFPFITIRDMVNAHILLRKHLGIDKIFMLAGGSMGGYQVMEWSLTEKEVIDHLFLLATSAKETAWGIATHTAQRLCIEADESWQSPVTNAGAKGLKAARAVGMLTYRNYGIFVQQQSDEDVEKMDNFKASSYINYQGEKLTKRFNAMSYWGLTKSMDSHNLARGRNTSVQTILNTINQKTLIIGISSDQLCPVIEQEFIANNLPNALLKVIHSDYGHDGFLVEHEQISREINDWIKGL